VVSGSVKLFPDNSTDDPSGTGLYVVSAPTPVALGTFTGGAVTVAGLTNLTLSPSAPETFRLVLSLNALGGGDFLNTVSPSGIIATGVNTHAPALVNGGPFNGNDQTVLAATATPSNTLTSTATSTDSATPTITLTPVFSYTVTSTPTSTETPLFTYTVTSTSTGTSTPSTTSTITSTDTTTWTSTPTETSTNSPTSTPTSTLSPTQTLTPEPTVYIPDPNLLNAVENLLFDNSVIPSTTSPIYPENMATITSLTVNSVGVTSLVGLEDCSAVTFIDLNSNSVTDLSPLSGLTGLTSLNLEFNRITDLSPVTGLSNLTSLDLYGNQISVLPNLTGLVSLTSLQLGYNLIVNISNLSVLTNLNYLVLDYNQITNVAPLASLANVQELFLYGNYIETIPDLTGMTSLTYLDLEYNYNPNDGNALMDISGLAGVTSLQNVYLNGNSISDVTALQYLTNLYYIDLDYNLITDLSPLLTNAAGNYWYGVYLSVMNEAFQNTPATYLTVQSEVLSLINNYSWQVNYQVDMPDQNLQNAIDQILFIDGGPVTPSNLQSINSLSFIAAGVTNIEGLEFCSAVTQIDLQWNAITDLTPLTNLTNITSLNMESNQVTDVTALSGLYWLTQLDLNNNQITNVSPLAALTNLQYLGLDDNTIYDISNWFNGYWVDTNNPFPYLIELELSGNQLTYLPTGFYLPSLTALYLEYDQIGDFQPLVDETQLETPVPPVMLNVTWDNFSNCSVQNEYNALINANWTLIGWQPCD
jgi:internalin A